MQIVKHNAQKQTSPDGWRNNIQNTKAMPAHSPDYENYNLNHSNFVGAYKLINEYVTDLYLLPKQFADDAGRVMNAISNQYAIPQSPEDSSEALRGVLDFVKQLDGLTLHTVNLFNEHKLHIDKTEVYMRAVEALEDAGEEISDLEYSELAAEVSELMLGLKSIKEKADRTIEWLDQLEAKWEVLKVTLPA